MALEVEWVGPPKSFTRGRRRPVQFVVLHYTAGSEGPTSAEGGADYDKRRTDGVSTHYFTDSRGPALQTVRDGDRAHTARFHGNEIGVQIEICGTRQSAAQWADATSRATLETTAALTALLCRRHGLPVRRLTTAQTRAAYYAGAGSRPKGITDHNACTFAFPEDGGTHTDVGPGFPWAWFLERVQAYYHGEGETDVSILGAKSGETGDRVKLLQRLLKMAGFPANDPGAGKPYNPAGGTPDADGTYGKGTAAAVLALRKSVGSVAESGASVTPDAAEQIYRVHAMAALRRAVEADPTLADALRGPEGKPGERGPVGPAGEPGRDGIGAGASVTIRGEVIAE
jgi:N-acetyl-anhydromuramyl-L-alanine amidase AmpD